MTMEFVSNYIDKKINANPNFIRFTFYELRIKENLTESDMLSFISLATQRLINNRYLVYRTSQQYKLNEEIKTVKSNELLIAIK
ncbi:MAG: hypothetical protein Q4G09_06605 [Clostridia bacterium]|nr:hypothetical protein [Clostridia bacterium]